LSRFFFDPTLIAWVKNHAADRLKPQASGGRSFSKYAFPPTNGACSKTLPVGECQRGHAKLWCVPQSENTKMDLPGIEPGHAAYKAALPSWQAQRPRPDLHRRHRRCHRRRLTTRPRGQRKKRESNPTGLHRAARAVLKTAVPAKARRFLPSLATPTAACDRVGCRGCSAY
jgi:hypothetical protein